MSKQISVIGCGWLGLPMAKHLIAKDYRIKGSTTSQNKFPDLESYGIEAFYVELSQDRVKGDIEKCLSGSDILILNIPPGLRKHPQTDFVRRMSILVPYIEKSSIENVLFISSTSVYGDEISIPTITENSIPNPDMESGKQLLEAEKMLQANQHFNSTILRFSGLIGEDRHPATYLSGKTDVKDPDAPVNLIHRDDCIGIINRIIESKCWNDIFNASTTPHPKRKEYYTSVCKAMDLPVPIFKHDTLSKGKHIDSGKLVQLLGYEFKMKLNN